MKNSWHVSTAAESFAAGQFARCGWDISVQYGANQPEYDLMVADRDRMMKASVKGSRHGRWGLTQTYLTEGKADYPAAADRWLLRHGRTTVFCLVQFKGVNLGELPRMYLVMPGEIAAWLKAAAAGRGDTMLYEHHAWTKQAKAAGTVDAIPAVWRFSENRVEAMASLCNSR